MLDQMHPVFDEDDKKAVADAFASGWVTEGPKTKKFEEALAKVCRVRYAIAVPNGTVAISLALLAAGVEPKQRVIVPDFTFAATWEAVKLAGAEPYLVDIDPRTFGINPVFSHPSRVAVHMNGRDGGRGLVVDGAQTLGSKVDYGEVATLSFHASKLITTGEGGAVLTQSDEIAESVRRLKNHGRLDKKDEHPFLGGNFKFNDIQAALGLSQLKKLNKRLRHKQKLCQWYQEGLKGRDGIEVLEPGDGEVLLWQDVLVQDRDKVAERLMKDYDVQTRPFYRPLHLQPAFADGRSFPVAQRVSSMGLWLPSSSDLTSEDVMLVCQAIKETLS